MTEFAIRAATADDAEEIARIHLESWRTTYRGIVPEAHLERLARELPQRAQRWRESIPREDGEWTLLAAVPGRGTVGFLRGGTARPPHFGLDGELGAIYLLEEFQHRGVGRSLVTEHVRALVGRGYRGMLVWVLSANPSRGFYLRLGGAKLGVAEWTVEGRILETTAYGWRNLESLATELAGDSSRKPFY
jgi:GNAT superfamily N-acetyltransferase